MLIASRLFLIIALAFMVFENSGKTTAQRSRGVVEEIEEVELSEMVKSHKFVAVAFHDQSKNSARTLKDLELIKHDTELFGIPLRRMASVVPQELLDEVCQEDCMKDGSEFVPAVTVVMYKHGAPVQYPGRPDRQTAVFRWILTEMFCTVDDPIPVDLSQFELLVRTFRNFVLITHAKGILKSRVLMQDLNRMPGLCEKLDRTLVVSSDDENLLPALGIDINDVPIILNIIHGTSVEYPDSDTKNLTRILEWIRIAKHGRVKEATRHTISNIIDREDMLLIICLNEKQRPLASKLKVSLADVETVFALAVVTFTDQNYVSSGNLAPNVTTFPSIILHVKGEFNVYQGGFSSEDAPIEIRNWVIDHLSEAEGSFVLKEIEASEFKSHPQDFKNVQLKEHEDSIRKLSTEYVKALKRNEELTNIIKDAMNVLEAVSSNEQLDSTCSLTSSSLSSECGDCLAAVGQAIWNCGKLEFECIENALGLRSGCSGCICEIMDIWWPEDAPNCFRKEINEVLSKKDGVVRRIPTRLTAP